MCLRELVGQKPYRASQRSTCDADEQGDRPLAPDRPLLSEQLLSVGGKEVLINVMF
jgi:hypothetical protein